ncbi:MAG TPA: phenylalanine--tRNA ligase subunit beta, partial [Ktedonobacterales bacterium]|nr:phenylalanine--tRNA ligase subunit beta [Ktedonobacterales bacterium]
LCSSRELGLSSDHSGIYLLPKDTPLGRPLAETIIDLDIKAHRGDLFSVTGVAREVAAFSGKQLRLPLLDVPERGKQTVGDLARVTVEDIEMCPRFTARVIRNIKIGPSPLWMVQRLAAAGMRSISNVVDITNYVMWETGQPLHAFDYDRVAEHRLIVRRAKKGETIRTLDDQERELTTEMMLVCDPTGPLSVAGVMGGATSEISNTTTNVLLEAATWNPVNIRRTSTKLGLRSESSSRFEKGLDPELARMGLDRAAQLMAELADGEVAPGYIDNYPQPVEQQILRFNPREVEWLMGYQVSPSEVADALTSLQFGVALDDDGENMTVTVPTWRGDVKESADLVEEVARMLGYDRITGTIPSGPLPEPQQVDWFERENLVRDVVSGAGCREVVTYPLTNRAAMLQILSDQSDVAPLLTGAVTPTANQAPAANGKKKGKTAALATTGAATALMIPPEQMPAITLANALSAKQDTLRLTLLVSLMETMAYNIHQGVKSVRIFELGRRYIPASADAGALPHERRSLGIMLAGWADANWLDGEREHDFFDLKAVVERLFADMHVAGARYTPTQHPTFHPGRCALIELATEGDTV